MKKIPPIHTLLLFAFFVASCAPASAAQTSTQTASPTFTAIPNTPSLTPTPEAPAFPAELTEYYAEVQKQGYPYEMGGDSAIYVDYGKGLEPAFTLNPETDKWEVEKFVYTPEGWDKVSALGMVCRNLRTGDATGGETMQHMITDSGPYRDSFVFKFRSTGKIVIESRFDPETGEKLPGKLAYLVVRSLDKSGNEFESKVVVRLDLGNGQNRYGSVVFEWPSINELASIYSPGSDHVFIFGMANIPEYEGIDLYEVRQPYFDSYRKFFNAGGYDTDDILLIPQSPEPGISI